MVLPRPGGVACSLMVAAMGFLFAPSVSLAATLVQVGANGVDRANGTNAGAGAPVTLLNAISDPTGTLTQTAIGGAGGTAGGNPCCQVDVPGGVPGAGGTASSTLSGSLSAPSINATAKATGGRGGSAYGQRTAVTGASATAVTNLTGPGAVNVISEATGGAGGNATNPFNNALNAQAGNGGTASATARGVSLSGGPVSASVVVTGGNGGNPGSPSIDYGMPGNGANAIAVDAVSAVTTGDITLRQTVTGGSGGEAFIQAGHGSGTGGSATSLLTAGGAVGPISGESRAVGGRAGTQALGGDATSNISLTGSGMVTVSSTAIGGGGRGMASALGNGTSTGGGPVSVTVTQTGGSGMVVMPFGGQNIGSYGYGADSIMTNAASGATAGALTLLQTATGGAGGIAHDAIVDGHGGIARSELNNTQTVGMLTARTEARGGAGGYGTFFQNEIYQIGGAGGDAEARTALMGTGVTSLSADAVGGAGGSSATNLSGGRGGMGTATVIASGGADTSATASARGGTGGSGDWLDPGGQPNRGGLGGNAIASADAVGTGFSTATARATPGSGGGGTGGAVSGDMGIGTAGSTATGAIGARAESYADGKGTTVANASSGSGIAQLVHAHADTSLTSGTASRTSSRAEAEAATGIIAGVAAGEYATAIAIVDSLPTLTSSYFDTLVNPNVNATFAIPRSTLFAGTLGLLGAANAASPSLLDIYSGVLDFSFDPSALGPGSDLLLGLLSPDATGTGQFASMHFQVTVEGQVAVDETFNNVLDAALYFDDNVIDLSSWTAGLSGNLDISLRTDITAAAGQRFLAPFVATTTPVPVPPAYLLFLSAIAVLRGLPRTAKRLRA